MSDIGESSMACAKVHFFAPSELAVLAALTWCLQASYHPHSSSHMRRDCRQYQGLPMMFQLDGIRGGNALSQFLGRMGLADLGLAALTQAHRMPDHLDSMRKELAQHDKASYFKLHNLAGDRCCHPLPQNTCSAIQVEARIAWQQEFCRTMLPFLTH